MDVIFVRRTLYPNRNTFRLKIRYNCYSLQIVKNIKNARIERRKMKREANKIKRIKIQFISTLSRGPKFLDRDVAFNKSRPK